MWVVYLVRCRDNSLYCGITNNLTKRLAAHNCGKGAKYIVVSRRPVVVVYLEKTATKSAAMRREIKIKRLSKKLKEKLVLEYDTDKNNRKALDA